MNVNFLVRTVLKYVNENSPDTPEEFNFRAELKAASHWQFFNDNERIKFVTGPFDDIRVKKVAAIALRHWIKELSEIEDGRTDAKCKMEDDDEDALGATEERISGNCITAVHVHIVCTSEIIISVTTNSGHNILKAQKTVVKCIGESSL